MIVRGGAIPKSITATHDIPVMLYLVRPLVADWDDANLGCLKEPDHGDISIVRSGGEKTGKRKRETLTLLIKRAASRSVAGAVGGN